VLGLAARTLENAGQRFSIEVEKVLLHKKTKFQVRAHGLMTK